MRLSRAGRASFGSWASSPCSPPPFPSLPRLAPHLSCPLFYKVTLPPALHTPAAQCVLSLHSSCFRWLLWVLKNCLGRRVACWEVGVGTTGAEAREAEAGEQEPLPPCVGRRALALGQVAFLGVGGGGPELGLEGYIPLLTTPNRFPAEENPPEA